MLAQGMGALKREVLTAYDARAAALSALHKATHTRLIRLAERRTKRAARQGAALAQGRSELVTHEAGRRQAATADLKVKRDDRRAAHRTWLSLAATLHTRRTGARATAAPAQATTT